MTNSSPDDRPDHPGVIAPPPLIYLGFLGLGFLLEWVLPVASHVSASPRYWLAYGLAGGGAMTPGWSGLSSGLEFVIFAPRLND